MKINENLNTVVFCIKHIHKHNLILDTIRRPCPLSLSLSFDSHLIAFERTSLLTVNSIDINMDYSETLKNFGIKPCSVKLSKIILSKIEMKCSVSLSSKEDLKLSWDLKQKGSKNFTLTVKRKTIDDDVECTRERPHKKVKLNEKIPLNDRMVKSM